MSPRLSDLFLSSQSDERLVSLAQAGHERAFAAIVERYRPELHALARRLCSDGRAEDVVQQAFLSAFAALRSGAEVKHLRGWLYQIVRNAANRSHSPLCVPLDGATASAETVEDVVQQRALAMSALTELARLPTRQRQAMVGTALDGRARAEVASTMGVSEGAVRQLVHRARASLRTAITAITPWPVARWLAVRPGGPGAVDLAAGAGAASSGGVALKFGALLASGTLLTGVAAVDLHPAPAHHAGAGAGKSARTQPRAGNAQGLELSAVTPAVVAATATAHPGQAGPAGSRHSPGRAGSSAGRGESRGSDPANTTTTRSEGREEGGPGHDDRGGAPGGDDRSSQSGPSSGSGSGSDGGGDAIRHDGGASNSGETSETTTTTSGSDDGHGGTSGSGSTTIATAVDGEGSGSGSSGSGSFGSGSTGSGSSSSGSSGSGSTGSGSTGSGSTGSGSSGSGSGQDASSDDGSTSSGHH